VPEGFNRNSMAESNDEHDEIAEYDRILGRSSLGSESNQIKDDLQGYD